MVPCISVCGQLLDIIIIMWERMSEHSRVTQAVSGAGAAGGGGGGASSAGGA